jgi:CHAT domain-containing protein
MLVNWAGDREYVADGYLRAIQRWEPEAFRSALTNWLRYLGQKLLGPIACELRKQLAIGAVLIPAGRLGILPLHAALYQTGSREIALLDEFEVSFAPSVKAVLAAREALAACPSDLCILSGAALGAPEIGQSTQEVQFADAELRIIASHFESRSALTNTPDSHDELLRALTSATHIHLAGRCSVDLEELQETRFQLNDRESLWLSDIVRRANLTGCRLAVLSSCQLDIADFRRLPIESLGLTAALLYAGAVGVISTLWLSDSLATPLLMEEFYRLHLRGAWPATALQRAVSQLRAYTTRELMARFNRERELARSGRSLFSDTQISAARNALFEYKDEYRPYDSPVYWAAFIHHGI